MRFVNPEALLFLLIIPLYSWLHFRLHSVQRGLPLPTFSFLKKIHKPFVLRAYIPILFFGLATVSLILALARPQFGKEIVKTKQKGVDIIVALDTSASMLAEDFSPNRMEAAKIVIADFIKNQENNRVGGVVFAGFSFTL